MRLGCGTGVDINYTLITAHNAFEFTSITKNSSGYTVIGYTGITVDVDNYESAPNVLSDVPSNSYSNVFFYALPWQGTDETFMIRDTSTYTSLQNAENGAIASGPVIPVDLQGGVTFAFISFRGNGITNLTTAIAANNASITNVTGTLGSNASISNQNMQSVYNTSETPEIVTDLTRGALSVKNGTGNADSVTTLFETVGGSSTALIDV